MELVKVMYGSTHPRASSRGVLRMPLKSSDELLERNANGLYDHETLVNQLSRGLGGRRKGGEATLLVVFCWYASPKRHRAATESRGHCIDSGMSNFVSKTTL